MPSRATTPLTTAVTAAPACRAAPRAWLEAEAARAVNYPLSRWWLRPLATWVAAQLAFTSCRPWHVTLVGLMLAATAAAVIVWHAAGSCWAAALILAAWLCDRIDGPLARRLGTASPRGAWLDANIDELVDLGLHVAIAAAAASRMQSSWPWGLLAAFLLGKYLFMYGMQLEAAVTPAAAPAFNARPSESPSGRSPGRFHRLVRGLYHAPANADVRIHLLAACVAANGLLVALAWPALYYNFRWMARYVLVCRRLPEGPA
ncbi:MAG: CDP-alcohol phosphatidyltransferase family protein [Pirellulales bacterium]